ncbi:MAG: winged helix-turn-helix transcriptional regulator [Halodesulfurarchaeum sp.]
MSQTRRRIADEVRSRPGIHFNGLVRSLDLATGQVQYHLRKLRSDGDVEREEVYGRTHYYPDAFGEWEQAALALLRRETTREVVGLLLERGPSRPAELAEELALARSTLEWHLNHLVEQDMVVKHRGPRNHVTLELTRPEETVALLQEADPSLLESMVSRYTRLVDQLLYDDRPEGSDSP